MLNNLFHFIKYNNAAIIILAVILILGGGVLAAGPEAIGEKQTSVQGLDNAALLAVDLERFNMDFKIANIEQDEKYYYVAYSYMDIAVIDKVWQYQLSQTTRKISKKIKDDLGVYMAKYLAKHYEARLRELKEEKDIAQTAGGQKRIEVTEYSGLIGRTLDLAGRIFPGYEAVKKAELPSPDLTAPWIKGVEGGLSGQALSADHLTQVYNDYVAAHPEIFNLPADNLAAGAGAASTPPTASSTPADQAAANNPASGAIDSPAAAAAPEIFEPETVEIIDLPNEPAGEPGSVEPAAPAPESDNPDRADAPAPGPAAELAPLSEPAAE